jgi:hypothetical protein
MKTKTNTCENCENEFEEGFQFCPHCGQKNNEALTLKVLFYNTINNYFSVDARFFKSFIPLMAKPGYLAQRFVAGKRLLYLHPAQMYLFISVIFFFLFSFISREQVENVDNVFKEDLKNMTAVNSGDISNLQDTLKNIDDLEGVDVKGLNNLDSIVKSKDRNELNRSISFDFDQKKVDSLIAIEASDATILRAMGMSDAAGFIKQKFFSQMLKFYKQRNGGSVLQGFYDSIPIAMFILLPIFAFILKLLYLKKGRFSHHLVFSFYFFSFLFMAFTLLIIANFIYELPDILIILSLFSIFFYLLLALKRFYKQGWFLSLIKTSIATFSFLMFVVPLAIILVGIATFMFY